MEKPVIPFKLMKRILSPSVFTIFFYVLTLFLISCENETSRFPIQISADKDHIEMGRTVKVEAKLQGPLTSDRIVLLPFVNGRRWGSNEFADKNGKASFIIPLPNPGPALIQVIAVPAETDSWMGLKPDNKLLFAGTYIPDSVTSSNTLLVKVKHRNIVRKRSGKTLFGMQWESWFTPGHSWSTSQGVPIMGIYENTDLDVYRQQILWFMDMGVDFIIPDWSNHIWGKKHWNERGGGADLILHTTQLFLEVLADMRDEGLDVPKVALMPGLSNGPPTTMVALNEQLDWIYQNYLRNPRFNELWQIYDGKPLIIILDTGVLGDKKGTTESAFRVPFFKWSLSGGDEFTEAQ